jgi:predicted transcriptional regulator
MKTLVLDVAAPEQASGAFLRAWRSGRAEAAARVSFATPEVLWRVLTVKRWGLLKALTGAGPMSIREAARRAGRDVRAVHADVRALTEAGVLRKTPEGRIEFPFDAIRVDFTLEAA